MLGEPNEKKSNMDDVEGLKVDPRFVKYTEPQK